MVAGRFDQSSPPQQLQRGLRGAFGQSGRFGEHSQTHWHRFPFRPRGLAVEIEVNEIRGGLLIVSDDIAHQDIEDVIVNGDGLAEARHQE